MPYKSKAQSIYLHINEPEIAEKWDKEGYKTKNLPNHKKPSLVEHMIKKLKEK